MDDRKSTNYRDDCIRALDVSRVNNLFSFMKHDLQYEENI